MKTALKLFAVLYLFFAVACSKDEPVPPQQQQEQQPEPEPELEPENQPPSTFTATVEVDKNAAQLSWTAAEDPDGDTMTYGIMLGDSLISSQTETTLDITGLIFEKDYDGKIIADDGNEHQIETTFNFTTEFLWLTNFEFDNFPSSERTYEYDDNNKLITLNRPGNGINVVYDGEGRLFSYDYFTYSWNESGQVIKVSMTIGFLAYTVDISYLIDN